MSATNNSSGASQNSSKADLWNRLTTFAQIALKAAFRRRKRCILSYLFWLVVYGATIFFYICDAEKDLMGTLPFLLPIAVVIFQMIYPTLFVRWVIVVPSCAYTVSGAYYLIRDIAENQWEYDRQGLALGLVFVISYTGACISLILSRSEIEGDIPSE